MKIKFDLITKFKRSKNEIYLAALSGIALGVSFPPLPFYWLAFAAMLPYFFVISKRESLAEINRITYVFAFTFNLITLYWVGSWTKEADPFLMISGAVLLFFNPLLFLIPSSLFALAKKNFGEKTAFVSLPFFWAFYEFIYGVTEFRFPWLTLGNSQAYFTAFIQVAEFIGVYGISLLILYINAFLFFSFEELKNGNKKKAQKWLGVAGLIFFLPIFYGTFFAPKNFEGKEITVGIVQPNLNPWKKWDTGNLNKQMDLYFSLSRKALDKGAQMLVYPESALPVYLTSPSYADALARFYEFVDSANVPLLTGMPDLNIFEKNKAPKNAKTFSRSKRKYTTYNAAYLFTPNDREIREYHKTLLVPFGEKIPYVEYLPFLGDFLKWEVGISSWNVGEGAKTLVAEIGGDSVKIGTVICIESIYPEYVSSFVKLGAEALFVITNDSWYGKSSGPYQHAAFARLRAVENRRYVVRAANGGISCIINPAGEPEAETELFTRTYLVGKIKPLNKVSFYSRFPYLIPAIVIIYVLGFVFLLIIRKGSKS